MMMKLPKLQTLKIAPNCVKLAEIAPNYPKLQKIASNCFELRHENLKKIGVKSIIKKYDLYIYGDYDLKKGAGIIKHNNDHRILMSFFIANMICKKNNIIKDKSSIKTSYPTFFKHISQFSN